MFNVSLNVHVNFRCQCPYSYGYTHIVTPVASATLKKNKQTTKTKCCSVSALKVTFKIK